MEPPPGRDSRDGNEEATRGGKGNCTSAGGVTGKSRIDASAWSRRRVTSL